MRNPVTGCGLIQPTSCAKGISWTFAFRGVSLSLFKISSSFFLSPRPANKCSSTTCGCPQLFALPVSRETLWIMWFWFCSQFCRASAIQLQKRSFMYLPEVRDCYYLSIIFEDVPWHVTVPFLDHMAWLKLLCLRKK